MWWIAGKQDDSSDTIRVLRHRVLLTPQGRIAAMLGAEVAVGSSVVCSRFPGVPPEIWDLGVWRCPSEMEVPW